MHKKFSFGKALALCFGLVVVFFFWGFIFAPGGSGSNVLLGIMLAIAGIYFIVGNLGPYLDSYFFHGGSRIRALAVYEAKNELAQMSGQLQEILNNRRKRKKFDEKDLAAAKSAVVELEKVLDALAENWNDLSSIETQIDSVKLAKEKAVNSMNVLLGQEGKSHFFTGWQSLVFALGAALALRFFIVEPYQIPSGSMIPTLEVGDHLFVSKLRYGIINPVSKTPSYLAMWSTPNPGDVIIFQAPRHFGSHAGQTWIKRVIAGPGQTVRVENSVVFVDGKPYKHVTKEERVDYLDYFGVGAGGWIFQDDGVWREQRAISTKERIDSDIVHDIYMRTAGERLPYQVNWPVFMQGRLPGLKCDETECTVLPGHLFVMGDNRGNSSDSRVSGAVPIENVKGKAIFIWLSVEGHRNLLQFGKFALPDFRWSRWFTAIN